MYLLNWKKLWILLLAVLILTACPGQPSFTLSVSQAKPGESVTANLSGMDGRKASVSVADTEASIISSKQDSVEFYIPDVLEGEQEVLISSEGKTAKGKVTVLAKTVLKPSFTLNPTQAAPGDEVTATLTDYSGIGATVDVAGKTATIKSATSSKVIFIVPDVPEGNQEVIIKSGDQEAKNTLKILPVPDVVLTLDRENAAKGETVTADVTGASLEGATLKVGDIATLFTAIDQDSFSFAVPDSDDLSAGPQKVIFETTKGNAERSLNIFGDIEKGKLTIILKPETNETEFQTQIGTLGFTLEDKNIPDDSTNLRFLGLSEGPCSGKLADIDVGDMPLGEAIKELEKLEQNGKGVALYVDGRSGYKAGTVDHLAAIGTPAAHTRSFTGSGTLIAVLDTGVGNGTDSITELGVRLRDDLAYDFVNQDDIAEDDFDQIIEGTDAGDGIIEGHGTPIAVLAAGSVSGVAPDAEILPIKTCDEKGKCLSSDVILGVCHAITKAQGDDMPLVINLSLGGDTPVDALEAVLDYALSTNVLVAAAAGNEGKSGSPVHYPAAFDLPGLVAVGALEAPTLSCVDFEEQKLDASYLVGQGFPDKGVDISFKTFFTSIDVPATGGFASITGDATNKILSFNNINADVAFAFSLEGLTLTYLDQGGTENLEVNGELKVVGALSELNDTTLGGVNITVTSATVGSGAIGVVRLEGSITHFVIGGQEFIIDNVCPLKTTSWQPANFSTRGDYLDISAPGKAIRSSSPSNVYSDYEGTSFSTPLVAGALALWREAKPLETSANIETELKNAAFDLGLPLNEVGAGLLDLSLEPQ